MNPLDRAWRQRQQNRRAHEGWGPPAVRLGGALVALGLLVPLVQRVFLAWLDGPASQVPDASRALLLRTGIVVVGWSALDVYTRLIRGGDREVLAIWPVEPGSVARFELGRLVAGRAWLVPATGLLLAPILLADPALWALALAHTAVIQALALAASAAAVLFAVEIAEAPGARPWLDAVRGNNHPAQAAFLYAPGAVLLGCGAFIQGAAVGVTRLHAGDPVGLALLLAPLLAAGACAVAVPGLARRTWFRAGAVMTEVDARYALLEDRTEALRVYLDWAVRFLPERVGRYALKDLRHGWRARRAWISGAWLVGLAAVVAAWTRDPSGPGRAAALGVLGVWVVASVGVQMERAEPEFLARWLPAGGGAAAAARVLTLGAWAQPAVLLGAVAAGGRQGVGAFALVFGAGELTVVLAAVAAWACGRVGGLPLYAPVAALGAAVVAMGVLG